MQMRQRRPVIVVAIVVACSDDPARVAAPTAPVIDAAAVAANPNNVLSAVVTTRVRLADSVAVRYALAGAPLDNVTPALVPTGEAVVVPVFGLQPDSRYALQIVAYGGSQTVVGESTTFDTGSLPADLPQYVASGSDPSDRKSVV